MRTPTTSSLSLQLRIEKVGPDTMVGTNPLILNLLEVPGGMDRGARCTGYLARLDRVQRSRGRQSWQANRRSARKTAPDRPLRDQGAHHSAPRTRRSSWHGRCLVREGRAPFCGEQQRTPEPPTTPT